MGPTATLALPARSSASFVQRFFFHSRTLIKTAIPRPDIYDRCTNVNLWRQFEFTVKLPCCSQSVELDFNILRTTIDANFPASTESRPINCWFFACACLHKLRKIQRAQVILRIIPPSHRDVVRYLSALTDWIATHSLSISGLTNAVS